MPDDIDFADLDELGMEVSEEFDALLELRAELLQNRGRRDQQAYSDSLWTIIGPTNISDSAPGAKGTNSLPLEKALTMGAALR